MALQTEIWVHDIQDNLFKQNAFVLRSVNHSAWVHNKIVHVPNAGANPAVQKNRSVLPGTITQRTDNDLTYQLAEFSTDPILITNIDSIQVSYDKRASVLYSHIETLGEVIGNNTAYAWVTNLDATRVVRTSGAASATALAPSATGTRKALVLDDIRALRAKLDNDNVPSQGRVLLIPSDMYNTQLLGITEVIQAQAYGSAVLPTGVVQSLLGFDIMIRPTVVVYSGGTGVTQTIKVLDGTGTPVSAATTDNLGAIAYHPNYVATALGLVDVFLEERKAAYYGDIMSALVMHGASNLRSDMKGIAVLVQG